MKLFVVALCVAVCSAAQLDNTYLPPGSARTAGGNGHFLATPKQSAPSGHAQQIPILKFNNDNNGDGAYRYEYETGNNIQAQEAGHLKNAGTDHEAMEVHGSYSYTGNDGVQYTVIYTADENGFQAQGAHLPTPPPIPEAILKSLQENAAAQAHSSPNSGAYQAPAAPRKPSFNSNTGYNY
ncbi:Cuticular protein 47Ef [Carabus blaptoides fortunei]